ncbi:hypothetical protein VTN00DRAFT_5825 [Thermoascus crustaceus]|uniref:uncharacterized protein n=1 Tax=Thermoascus crustaceus TaxID=5088 RepID=UPI003743105F
MSHTRCKVELGVSRLASCLAARTLGDLTWYLGFFHLQKPDHSLKLERVETRRPAEACLSNSAALEHSAPTIFQMPSYWLASQERR